MKQAAAQTEKLERILNWALGISIALIGISSAILSVAALAGLALPPALTRALGVVNLLALPVLVYSTVKKALNARVAAKQPARTAASNGVKKPKKKKRKK